MLKDGSPAYLQSKAHQRRLHVLKHAVKNHTGTCRAILIENFFLLVFKSNLHVVLAILVKRLSKFDIVADEYTVVDG
jgi:hypothetical protein